MVLHAPKVDLKFILNVNLWSALFPLKNKDTVRSVNGESTSLKNYSLK